MPSHEPETLYGLLGARHGEETPCGRLRVAKNKTIHQKLTKYYWSWPRSRLIQVNKSNKSWIETLIKIIRAIYFLLETQHYPLAVWVPCRCSFTSKYNEGASICIRVYIGDANKRPRGCPGMLGSHPRFWKLFIFSRFCLCLFVIVGHFLPLFAFSHISCILLAAHLTPRRHSAAKQMIMPVSSAHTSWRTCFCTFPAHFSTGKGAQFWTMVTTAT